jgi:hypothetical protein
MEFARRKMVNYGRSGLKIDGMNYDRILKDAKYDLKKRNIFNKKFWEELIR